MPYPIINNDNNVIYIEETYGSSRRPKQI